VDVLVTRTTTQNFIAPLAQRRPTPLLQVMTISELPVGGQELTLSKDYLGPGVLSRYLDDCYRCPHLRIMDLSRKTRRTKARGQLMEWSEEQKEIEGINGDRRHDRRYEIQLDLRWKLIRRRRVLETGVGRTVALSSGGILFDPGRQLPVGLNVELSISWPVLLRNTAAMQLIVSGRIVRASQNGTAVAMAQHEFRTTGMPADQRATPRTPSALLSNGAAGNSFGKYR